MRINKTAVIVIGILLTIILAFTAVSQVPFSDAPLPGNIFKNSKISVVSSIVKNSVNPLNISWKLDNKKSIINSTYNLELNTSQQAIVVIESNFSDAGFYSLNFQINSSTYNDNQTGVAVT